MNIEKTKSGPENNLYLDIGKFIRYINEITYLGDKITDDRIHEGELMNRNRKVDMPNQQWMETYRINIKQRETKEIVIMQWWK